MAGSPESPVSTEVTANLLADLTRMLLAARAVGGLLVWIGQSRVVGEIPAKLRACEVAGPAMGLSWCDTNLLGGLMMNPTLATP